MIHIAVRPFNAFRENTYILTDETGACLIVDPGNYSAAENAQIADYIKDNHLIPRLIVITHAHVDHVSGVRFLQERYRMPFAAHSEDAFLLAAMPVSSKMYGFDIQHVPNIDIDLSKESSLKFGHSEVEVIHVPGHSPGHIALYSPRERFLIAGDVLFAGSIGRTDLPGGDYKVLMESILGKIVPLGGDVTVYPGHGRSTTISQELERNPFITEVLNGEVTP